MPSAAPAVSRVTSLTRGARASSLSMDPPLSLSFASDSSSPAAAAPGGARRSLLSSSTWPATGDPRGSAGAQVKSAAFG